MLSVAGRIANKFWEEIPQHFPIIILDEFVIMPDHIHGILIIDNPILNINHVETPNLGVSTTTNWKRNSIGSIVNQYKRICTIEIRKSVHEFKWHSGYYDHIVRSQAELMRIRKYIRENPLKIKNHL
jgi:REP element-mobilizing transposase RayT